MRIAALVLLLLGAAPAQERRAPNIIFILADDLAQGDLGCYGQKKIKTPNLDRLAAEGTRFTQAYSGTSVCAPSRASLMLGLHMGHNPVRANREIAKGEGQMPLPAELPTVAEVLQKAGYATACTGKWGLGMFGTTGSPLKKGFDHFYGYNCQRHAHSYFPSYLYDDDRRVELDGKTYAADRIADDTLGWVRKNAAKPFFLFHATTLPHGKHEIDDLGEYAAADWTPLQKTYAAMVSRLDRHVGRLLDLLKELGIDKNTLILFAGDNGSAFASDSPVGSFFEQAGGLRGHKRGMYEGGLRQAALARWPGEVPAGRVSHEPWAFWDFLPTAAELAGAPGGFKTDGVSITSLLRGAAAPPREAFYWELHEGGRFIQAVRFGDWKAVRNGLGAPLELYDLKADPGESKNLAAEKAEVVARAETLLESSRVDDPRWPRKKK